MKDKMPEIIYAFKLAELSYSDWEILDVKIGKTTDLDSTVLQHKKSNRKLEILDLWYPNEKLTFSSCEKSVQDIAEKYAYERDNEKFIFLQDHYNDFSDIVSGVLKTAKKDKLEEKRRKDKVRSEGEKIKDRDYTGERPRKILFMGKEFQVYAWRDVISTVASEIYKEVEDFSKALDIKGRKHYYFSKDEEELRQSVNIPNTPYYCEGKVSANMMMNIVVRLLNKFNIDESELGIWLKE